MPVRRSYPDAPLFSVSILCRHEEKVLLVKRSKDPFKDHWSLPGGMVELGETTAQAAERELLEETGVTARFHEVAEVFDSIQRDEDDRVKSHFVLAVMLATYESGEAKAADDAADLQWATLSDLQDLLLTPGTAERVARLFPRFPET